jgi:prolyl-tRNA synthetase
MMAKKKFVKDIASQADDYSQWYLDVVKKADLADYTDVRGCMVIKPYGYTIWEKMKDALDKRIKATGHQNAYFPLFVPESYLKKEAEHVEGFAPECAWVTVGGNTELEERLAIRPTSEAIIGACYSKWIQSYRDLPLLINQWANVVRWEMRTRPFLRTCEFLWQEGHTCHRTEDEAMEEVLRMLEVYRDFMENEMAMPVITGPKSASERFAGAQDTYTCEALMGDGNALQAGTSHALGQGFAKGFDIKFLDEDNKEKYVWQTSWGVSTRLMGGLIMTHGDDDGLIVPPNLAPYMAAIVPIYRDDTKAAVMEVADKMSKHLRVQQLPNVCDGDDSRKPGAKFAHWELRGVPVRIEIGPRDVEAGVCVMVRRDTREKKTVSLEFIEDELRSMLNDVQCNLYDRAAARIKDNTFAPKTYDEFKASLEERRGLYLFGWDGTAASEEAIKSETKATLRCLPQNLESFGIETPAVDGLKDFITGEPAKHVALFARAY